MPSDRAPTAEVSARPGSGAPSSLSEPFVVAIGSSAGGLEACQKLVDGLDPSADMAYLFVQHLDPSHPSLMVELLASHTKMPVVEAAEGAVLEKGRIYVMPPAVYLAVEAGTIRLSRPSAPRGARLPFDFLLQSLARAKGARAACIVLSGAGADGSLGLMALKAQGGLVIAQAPSEAAYPGMPTSAVATGDVDAVLPVSAMPAALASFAARPPSDAAEQPPDGRQPDFLAIVDLVRERTGHDFSLYKPGTLMRRIDRRVGLAGYRPGDLGRYLERLHADAGELEQVSRDLLINVTSFFRDPLVFEELADAVVPELVRACKPGQALRVWVAGCSTGEETYSLAMLLCEEIALQKTAIKLQIFASDLDAEAVAAAREGFYGSEIEADVSKDRLARFFSKEDRGYRVVPELRGHVVFTVQDVLGDPPFSRLDFVSCRNLLIYLQPKAQAKVLSIFHFALKEGGLLLLGAAEAAPEADSRYVLASKAARLYRHVGRSRPGEFGLLMATPAPSRVGLTAGPSQQAALADYCRRLVVDAHAPAAVLINARCECLYSLGPTDRYLRVAPGAASHDLMSMVRHGMRSRLRSAINEARASGHRVVVRGGRTDDGAAVAFNIEVRPASTGRDPMMLVCFLDEDPPARARGEATAAQEGGRVAELEAELELARADLRNALADLEAAGDEQTAISEEALSVNEENQSTNEELLTSKEELQSLNEELTALNSQLQESLERQRTLASDLQNILYSTDVPTIFLDADLKIRFFTPATLALINILPGDVGRPLADLSVLGSDENLLVDAARTLSTHAPIDHLVEAKAGDWFIRRIQPYLAKGDAVEGVVITFTDVTERRVAERALERARTDADAANLAKSRFLAAASHDLRQPLQTLVLLQGLLSKKIEDPSAKKLVVLLEQTVGAMSGMLNTLLDINEIDAGVVRPETVSFSLNLLIDRLRTEFTYHARAKRLEFSAAPCSVVIDSDPRLLEQMVRNLLTNALKYTSTGKVLLGCRRHGDSVTIQVLDTGLGIPESELATIFDEYHQLNNKARERARGLGLGLSIVRRLSSLLGHEVAVTSALGRGSVFSITAPRAANGAAGVAPAGGPGEAARDDTPRRGGAVLLVEDDPEVRDILAQALAHEGYDVVSAPDGLLALEALEDRGAPPDLILADYNLPGEMSGLRLAEKIRQKFQLPIPVIILTGDISTDTLTVIADHACTGIHKPVDLVSLAAAVQRALLTRGDAAAPTGGTTQEAPAVVYVVDDDGQVRDVITGVLEADGFQVVAFSDAEGFLQAYRPGGAACLLLDAALPGMSGLQLLTSLRAAGDHLPAVMITGTGDLHLAVEVMKLGASDFIEKPVGREDLINNVERALAQSRDEGASVAWRARASARIALLTARQMEIMTMVLAGHPSKNIAADLGISQRTVESHRAAIMHKTGATSLPALARLALAADPIDRAATFTAPADGPGRGST